LRLVTIHVQGLIFYVIDFEYISLVFVVVSADTSQRLIPRLRKKGIADPLHAVEALGGRGV
jgi:hypothetical protein